MFFVLGQCWPDSLLLALFFYFVEGLFHPNKVLYATQQSLAWFSKLKLKVHPFNCYSVASFFL